ncbi:hypothetical protein F5Y16DRAFT_399883 [Xylariaceae sp. FL0255]|nr:hypothetical protein F5Y16DRAFT_399883 [Xylariaceae sp. FL0255]
MSTSETTSDKEPAWEVKAISTEKGRGLFAKMNIQAGDIIHEESTTILYPKAGTMLRTRGSSESSSSSSQESSPDSRSSEVLALEDKVNKLLQIYRKLDQAEKDKWKSLHMPNDKNARAYAKQYMKRLSSALEDDPKVLAKLFVTADANAYETEDCDGLYLQASLFNHSCDPNVWYDTRVDRIDKGKAHWTGRATRNIQKGDELCTSYIELYESKEQRRNDLRQTWGFVCACPRCAGEKDMYTTQLERALDILEGSQADRPATSFVDSADDDTHVVDRRIQLWEAIGERVGMGSLFCLLEASRFHLLRSRGLWDKDEKQKELDEAKSSIETAKRISVEIPKVKSDELVPMISDIAAQIYSEIDYKKLQDEKAARSLDSASVPRTSTHSEHGKPGGP